MNKVVVVWRQKLCKASSTGTYSHQTCIRCGDCYCGVPNLLAATALSPQCGDFPGESVVSSRLIAYHWTSSVRKGAGVRPHKDTSSECGFICSVGYPSDAPSMDLGNTTLSWYPQILLLTKKISLYYKERLLLSGFTHLVFRHTTVAVELPLECGGMASYSQVGMKL